MAVPLEKITATINNILPASFSDEMRQNVQVAVHVAIGKMNLVTRPEIEKRYRRLPKVREKIDAMKELVSNLKKIEQTAGKSQQ